MNDDKTLIKKLKSKDAMLVEEGFEGIYHKYFKLIYVCINNIVRNTSVVEDLIADTFLKLYENRDKIDDTRNFKYYLVTIAKNLSINYVKDKNNLNISLDDTYLDNIEEEKNELNEIINVLDKYLNEEEIKIIINHLIFGFTFEEIAKKMNVNTNSIKTKYYRAIKKVQNEK